MIIGYARVSTTDQKLHVQSDQLTAAGCEKLFSDQLSGADIERPGLTQMLDFVREGDTVIVTKTDRIARSARDALDIADQLRRKNVGFKLLDLGDVDINSDMGRMIYTVMSAFAEMERNRIRQRQREGIEKAREQGKHLGRPPIIDDPVLQEKARKLLPKMERGVLSKSKAAQELGIGRATLYRLLAQIG